MSGLIIFTNGCSCFGIRSTTYLEKLKEKPMDMVKPQLKVIQVKVDL